MNSNIKVGDIFIAADGGKYGHLVIDVDKYSYCDDVVTIPFTASDGLEIKERENRIDQYKLKEIRYFLPPSIPSWIPDDVKNYFKKDK